MEELGRENMSTKVHFSTPTELNIQIFKDNGIEILETPDMADYIFASIECKYKDRLDKTIYIAREPPKEPNVSWYYNNFDKFKLVVAYDPDPSKPNQIPYNPPTFPNWTYLPSNKNFVFRENTKIRNRSIFFAGTTKVHDDQPYKNTVRIRHLRKIIGTYFLDNFPGSVCVGIGWNNQRERDKLWREDKYRKIKESETDFVLSLENTIMPNYITEKIWDGFATDKVTLYLGDPNIDTVIPKNCYIDLRPYYDLNANKFDLEGLGDRVKKISQEEYDAIIKNARKIRNWYVEDKFYYKNLLTKTIINKIKEWETNKNE